MHVLVGLAFVRTSAPFHLVSMLLLALLVVHDMLRRKALKTDIIKMIVLDEAGELLSPGFTNQIYRIFQQFPSTIQVGIDSVTTPPDALEFIKDFMKKPVRILRNCDELTPQGS
ncbi:OLC1v1015073C1 [Oldenlandia corymbosa var. corymbosa]|uniref:OLC1v1015073C1 n=1 Tax=Oldenlandia corymbosa var. corymbosa TaxID=529605 RepID=A0AAV1E2G9_OLDCO|nr:OLC1v1015073C1 [Oldenlandia corymbosa var. corymbosa]